MDLKKLFNSNKAVSPVIGVVLMVAITVILAAAIGSSVFGQGPAKSAPQANINAKFVDGQNLVIEHLGGDTLVWDNTVIRFTKEDGTTTGLDGIAIELDDDDEPTGIIINPDKDQFSVGDIEKFNVADVDGDGLSTGEVFNLKISDKVTNQLICDKKLRT